MDVAESPSTSDGDVSPPFPAGTRVEVRNGFDRTWSKGFVVIGHDDGGYRLQRGSDDAELPGSFTAEDVRRERRRSTWWV